ncbi:hypothetical protein BDP55DRAFT_192612 [Colletotrichum godetiae]|uniref:Uncharacterized protein n=1 Tax=Colletotrichum godetiae TaxID=1209918 RepID=A0AAJ0EU11_9PEZI|nr:uncharacterized protein BDP55DRAFT_192612 [Colletotrichum godetiae]KAK1673853.1 hypothetical protein BDP55DRAFT_192612 [Colletotrichum godetiae]
MIWETPNAGLTIACFFFTYSFLLKLAGNVELSLCPQTLDFMADGSLKPGRTYMTTRLGFNTCRTEREFGVALRHADTSSE